VRHACRDIHVVPCIGRQVVGEPLAVPQLCLTTEEINGGLVVLMQMCAGPSARWDRKNERRAVALTLRVLLFVFACFEQAIDKALSVDPTTNNYTLAH